MEDTIQILEGLEEKLKSRIIGQDHVVKHIVKAVMRGEWEITNEKRPRGCFLFLGPTGVGKTELTLALAQELFGSEDSVLRFDMSGYMERSSITNLIGNESQGFPGQLGSELQRLGDQPGILLFDEIEKAHPDVMDIFMQILSAARITTGDGITHNLNKCYIILTSNLCAEMIEEGTFKNQTTFMRALKSEIIASGYRREFIGRFGHNILCFNKLDFKAQKKLAKLVIELEIKRIKETKGIDLDYTDNFLYYVIRFGQDPRLGARPMLDFVENNIQSPVVNNLQIRNHGHGTLDACEIEAKTYLIQDGVKKTIRPKLKESDLDKTFKS